MRNLPALSPALLAACLCSLAVGADKPTSSSSAAAVAASTFIQQGVESPVGWKRWSAAALEAARSEGRPLFIHIGTATDGLARAMREETFSNAETAQFLNTHFTNILIDRLAEPAVAAHFGALAERKMGRAGWPLNIWATPDARPFEIARYLPASEEWGEPGFPNVMEAVVDRWENSRDQTIATAGRLAEASHPGNGHTGEETSLADLIDTALEFSQNLEPGAAPSLPAMELNALARLARSDSPKAPEYRKRFEQMLDRTLDSALHDHVGGGFFTGYASEEGEIPTFRKLLIDQALMIDALVIAEPTPFRREVLDRTVNGLLRDFASTGGAFLAAWDSVSKKEKDDDSSPPEGSYYLIRHADLEAILAPDATDVITAQYGLKPAGNISPEADVLEQYTGLNIFRRILTDEEVNEHHGLRPGSLPEIRARSFAQLVIHRNNQNPRPVKDTSQIVEWNALTIASLLRAARVLERKDLVEPCRAMFSRMQAAIQGPVPRRLIGAKTDASPPATLADHAAAGQAALELFETTGDEGLRDFAANEAKVLGDAIMNHVLMQPVPLLDDAYPAVRDNGAPSATALALDLFDRLAAAGVPEFAGQARTIREAVHADAQISPESSLTYLAALLTK